MTNEEILVTEPNQIRIEMSKLGWISEDKLSWMGWGNGEKYGYSIWFERWDWHGVQLGNSVSFGCHDSDLTKMDECVRKAAKTTLKAWDDFPSKIPTVLANGKVVAKIEYLQPEEFKDK